MIPQRWLVLAVALVAWPLRASADLYVEYPGTSVNTFVWVGNTSIRGTDEAMVIQLKPGGLCHAFFLGQGGLRDNVRIQLPAGADSVEVTDGSFPVFCGATTVFLNPLVTNGFKVVVNGGFGDDSMWIGTTASRAVLEGSEGHDTLTIQNPNGGASGGPGNDFFYGDLSSSSYHGDQGNDRFCVHAQGLVNLQYGGSGSDSRCGRAVFMKDIESTNCPVCGPGF